LLAAAFADHAVVTARTLEWTVDTPEAVELPVPLALHDFYLEGAEWPYWRRGFVMVPPGHHVVTAYRPWLRLIDLGAAGIQQLHVVQRAALAELGIEM